MYFIKKLNIITKVKEDKSHMYLHLWEWSEG